MTSQASPAAAVRAPRTDGRAEIVYPDSDGRPMSDNTKQFHWIQLLQSNLDIVVPDFVAGDLLWYPVEDHPEIRIGPDVMVVVGRPKGHRSSYRQWLEGGVAPAVVFEVLSPGNTMQEMTRKSLFYRRYGVRELVFIDPDREHGWASVTTDDGIDIDIDDIVGWTSPTLGIRFDRADGRLVVYRPNGDRFLGPVELDQLAREASERAEREAERAEREAERAEREAERAEREAERAERLAEKLRALGVDPDAL